MYNVKGEGGKGKGAQGKNRQHGSILLLDVGRITELVPLWDENPQLTPLFFTHLTG
jgi:hypothetical protein